MTHTLEDVLRMPTEALREIVSRGAPLDLDALAESSYTGIDLSMPALFHKLMWKTFRKTFHRDRRSGALRGWNVRVEQTGWERPPPPLLDRRGRPITFGHYEVRSAEGLRFPRGFRGGHYLDYGVAGNRWTDPARFGYAPLVAVNEGEVDLLLGWEVFKIGSIFVPLADYWVLVREGPLAAEDVVARPSERPPR